MEQKDDLEVQEGEVVTDEIEADPNERRVRVYERGGDFVLTLPPGCRLTFGYFNPQAAGGQRSGYNEGHNTSKMTCLRVYADSTDKRQLAAFLGVNGFRDLTIKKVTLSQSVTITTNFEDDGQGTRKAQAEAKRALVAGAEEGDDSIPF